MLRILLSSACLAITTACTTLELEPIDPSDFVAANAVEPEADYPVKVVETVQALPLPGQVKPVTQTGTRRTITRKVVRHSSSPSDTIERGRSSALVEPSVDGYVNAIQIYPYTEGALYRLYASPGQVTDIALQAGEHLVSVSAGDTVRWVVGDTISGSGKDAKAHILVKPIASDIRTNLMIATDRRTYHLELESVSTGYMAALSWRYPKDEIAALTARNRRAIARDKDTIESQVSLDGLNFDYRLSGDRPAWRPVRIFDDGRQVYIQLPENISSTDMPPLFVLGTDGEAELVNYRVKGNYYVVDRLFRAAELRLGERRQTVVRITKVERATLAEIFGG